MVVVYAGKVVLLQHTRFDDAFALLEFAFRKQRAYFELRMRSP